MRISIFACYVTLADGSRVTGYINAASYADARSQIVNTASGATARAVVVVRAH
jgi:hypothetical protein